jgi:hypothetical protein
MRLAMRVEGNHWVAYAATLGTMEGALELGRVQMAVVQSPERKRQFMGLMQSYLGEFIAAKTGVPPDWNEPVAGPEHERAGRA